MRRRAFTIIELLVVISIIGILAAILLPTFSKVRKVARCGATQGTIRALEQALRAYHDDNTAYPVEDKSDVPTTGFLFQIQTMGLNCPYVRDIKMNDVVPPSTPLAANAVLKDPWYLATKQNHLHYRRGPHRSEGYTSEALYKAALAKFYGNDATFNLWSFGPNQVDDSSDQADAAGTFTNALTGGSGGDEGTDPEAADKSGIKDDLTNWNSNSSSGSKQ